LDIVFIQTSNKFHTAKENTKDIEFINSICNQQPPNDFTISYLFYTNKLVQKHNGNVFTNTLGPTFIFKAMDINHQSCPQSYNAQMIRVKLQVCILQFIYIYIYMLVELCVDNYATFDAFVNGTNGILKTSTTYCEKTII
jgi:hypothetical protein